MPPVAADAQPRHTGGGAARFEVVEDKAEVVRRIFRRVGHQERISPATVSRRLFEAGVPSPTGDARWSRSMVGVLLSDTAYVGPARFGKNASVPWWPPPRPARGRSAIPQRPSRQVPAAPERWIAIPVPALVEAALFEGAQGRSRAAGRHRLKP
jgi:site-specific DNA recombinase